MLEPLRLLPFLLVPVAALLFLNLRLSRKLRYPHDLLRAEERRGAASFLFRSFRTYYDVLLDAAIAVAVAFALAPPERARPAAVVIDGSRSMVAGFAGERTLDKALKRIRTDPALQKAEPFLLVFDPRSAVTRLVPLADLGTDPEGTARRLRETHDFFAPDYGRLVELRRKGYGEITLLTDQLRVTPEGFKVLALGMAVGFAAYPTGVRFDRASGSWLVTLAESGPRVPIGVSRWEEGERLFVRLALERYRIEEGASGRIVRFPAPGLYLLSLKGPFGLEDIHLPLLLGPGQTAAAAAGPFSRGMLSVFPDIDRSAPPRIVLADRGERGPTGERRITTALVPRDGDLILDPAQAGGALIAVGSAPDADLALGPSSLENEDLVLAYHALLGQQDPPFRTVLPPGAGRLQPAGSAYLPDKGSPLIPPSSQFFETRPGPRLALPPPTSVRWPWVLLLALLSAAKLALWRRLTGKSLLARETHG